MRVSASLVEKIRKARELRTKAERIESELNSLKGEILEIMGVGNSVVVDNVKTYTYEGTRKTIIQEKVEALLNRSLPKSCFKETVYPNVKVG